MRVEHSYALGVLSVQQPTICGNLLLQTGLDVQKHLIFLILPFHVASEFSQLFLYAGDHGLELCQLGTVSGFCICQVGFQPSFLK